MNIMMSPDYKPDQSKCVSLLLVHSSDKIFFIKLREHPVPLTCLDFV